MTQNFLTILILFSSIIPISLQNIVTIIKEFHFMNPHLIGTDIKLELLKLLFKDGHFLNVYPKIEEFSFNENATTNAIIFLNSEENCIEKYHHLDLPKKTSS